METQMIIANIYITARHVYPDQHLTLSITPKRDKWSVVLQAPSMNHTHTTSSLNESLLRVLSELTSLAFTDALEGMD